MIAAWRLTFGLLHVLGVASCGPRQPGPQVTFSEVPQTVMISIPAAPDESAERVLGRGLLAAAKAALAEGHRRFIVVSSEFTDTAVLTQVFDPRAQSSFPVAKEATVLRLVARSLRPDEAAPEDQKVYEANEVVANLDGKILD